MAGDGRRRQSLSMPSLQEGMVLGCLEEAAVRPLLQKFSLELKDLNNYRMVANGPFLGKILEWVVSSHFWVGLVFS